MKPVAQFQDDYDFIDKLTGLRIKILKEKSAWIGYQKAYRYIKRQNILTHNTQLTMHCELN
ncbi:MAG TPA: hypothetical protein PKL30_24315 [Leptospiraceae bacterium]|nr:hypothetical protein [Leptospiraceae bacterium]HMW08351.1 hypothetical protein [Leptospiraceae bacterium]HMY34322.1 hypothetical protein [Leptospiraceae bacterium]HMZ67514.1 hypothetical protein [Leptospiraceae bacterium]HNA10487.1 hypothetical protein [Leptospiraceae bacterium]